MSKNKQKEKEQTKKRKKWPWILLCVVLILAIVITVLVKWQWNNITALYYASKYTQEELTAMQEENEAKMQELCVQVSQIDPSLLPEEAQALLQTGELSEETAIAVLTGQITWEEAISGLEKPAEVPTGQIVSRVDEIVAKMYVLQSGYVGKLDSLVGVAWSEYKQGGISKQDLINKYLSIGYGLEAECDAQMESLLSELHSELVRTGGDTNLISEIRHVYQSQKSIKKAEMIAKYQK